MVGFVLLTCCGLAVGEEKLRLDLDVLVGGWLLRAWLWVGVHRVRREGSLDEARARRARTCRILCAVDFGCPALLFVVVRGAGEDGAGPPGPVGTWLVCGLLAVLRVSDGFVNLWAHLAVTWVRLTL